MNISDKFPTVHHGYAIEKRNAWKRDLESIASQIDRYFESGSDVVADDLQSMLDLGALRRELRHFEENIRK
jgi:hypothetical protein